ncbi:MAG: hypothetical protein JXR95_05400 [Deltaproteobacteria bacterium]|nr:hypothetical protein [Deltaproteobacteria bacterium]
MKLLYGALVFFLFPSQALGRNYIEVGKKVGGIKRFDPYAISSGRYVSSQTSDGLYLPVIIDLKTNTRTVLKKLHEYLKNSKDSGTLSYAEQLKLKLDGKWKKWYSSKIISFDGLNIVGLLHQGVSQGLNGNPSCKKCGATALKHKRTGKYYCPVCNRYLLPSSYLKIVDNYYLARVNLKSKKSETIKVEGSWQTGATDFRKKIVYIWKEKKIKSKRKRKIKILQIDFENMKKLSATEIDMPYRDKNGHLTVMLSRTGKYLVFFEYDEYSDTKKKTGYLSSPTGRALIINTSEMKSRKVEIPVTPYGFDIDESTNLLAVGSNQAGELWIINLIKGKTIKKIKIARGVFHMVFSRNYKYLYVFNKRTFDTYLWKNLKKTNSFKVSKLCNGVEKFLASEKMISFGDSGKAIIGVIKKSKYGPWGSSSFDDGFQILNLKE